MLCSHFKTKQNSKNLRSNSSISKHFIIKNEKKQPTKVLPSSDVGFEFYDFWQTLLVFHNTFYRFLARYPAAKNPNFYNSVFIIIYKLLIQIHYVFLRRKFEEIVSAEWILTCFPTHATLRIDITLWLLSRSININKFLHSVSAFCRKFQLDILKWNSIST